MDFRSIKRIKNNTNKGCVAANNAAKPLSTYLNAQTKTPLP